MPKDDDLCPLCGRDLTTADKHGRRSHIKTCTDPRVSPSPASKWTGGRGSKLGGKHRK